MKRALGIVIVVAVLGIIAGGFWWSHKHARRYDGLAGHFPASTQVFAEVKEMGQWMEVKDQEGGSPSSVSNRGVDPMMQVLGQVWAAQPVKPADLPELLRGQPVALGVWRQGADFKGLALMPLGPGQAKPLTEFLASKLGEGEAVGTVAGVPLKRAAQIEGVEHLEGLLWGVSDAWAVMATGLEEAKASLEPAGDSLEKDPAFLETVKRMPFERGALLFVRGDLMAQLAKDKLAGKKPQDIVGGEEEPRVEPPKAEEPKSEEPKAEKPEEEEKPAEGPAGASETFANLPKELGALATGAMGKALALESLKSLAVWTNPPEGEQKGWRVKAFLALNEPPKGLWRILAEGSASRPELLNRLPKEAGVYVWGGGKDPARVYQLVLDEMGKDLAPEQMGWVRSGIGAAEGKLGLSFANDLLPTLGSEWCYVGDLEKPEEGGKGRFGFYIGLRDPRRFESLVAEKIAVQLHLGSEQLQGARAWSWGGEGGPKALRLVVSGGVAILTNDPAWALATAGTAGKPYEQLAKYGKKASGLCVMDPAAWSEGNDVLAQVAWTTGPGGLEVDARFPGKPPRLWDKKGCGGHPEEVSGTSPEAPGAPAASGSL